MPYKFALGFNNTAGLVTVSIQPASPGVKIPERLFDSIGGAYDDGSPFTEWRYSGGIDDADYTALLTEFSLLTNVSKQCTITTLDFARVFRNYNATIHRPENEAAVRFRYGLVEDLVFRLVELVQI